jgi:hypothetical protein
MFADRKHMTSITAIPDGRDLTAKERRLVEWLLDHGSGKEKGTSLMSPLSQFASIARLRV